MYFNIDVTMETNDVFQICLFSLQIGFNFMFTNGIIILHLNKHYFIKVLVTADEIQAEKTWVNMTKWQMLSLIFISFHFS